MAKNVALTYLGFHTNSSTYQLHVFGQVAYPVCDSVSSSIKMDLIMLTFPLDCFED